MLLYFVRSIGVAMYHCLCVVHSMHTVSLLVNLKQRGTLSIYNYSEVAMADRNIFVTRWKFDQNLILLMVVLLHHSMCDVSSVFRIFRSFSAFLPIDPLNVHFEAVFCKLLFVQFS